MKKKTFVGNLVAWGVVLAACVAFQVWYRTEGMVEALEAIAALPVLQGFVILSGPLLLYGLGVVAGLVFARVRKPRLGRTARTVVRVVSAAFLANLALCLVPLLLPGDGVWAMASFSLMVVVYLSFFVPVLYVALGFLYALCLVPVDADRPSRLAKYLPDDHFD